MNKKQYTVSSLEKVFPYDEPILKEDYGTAFKNERYGFQLVLNVPVGFSEADITIDSDINDYITVRNVELVPARFAKYPPSAGKEGDGYYIKGHGNNELYPDLLRPIRTNGGEFIRNEEWTAYFITVDGTKKELPVGKHLIEITVKDAIYYKNHDITDKNGYNETSTYTLEIFDGVLPKLSVVNTCWLHYDSICDKHNVEPFTNEFYYFLDKYVSNIVAHGQNMLYIPMFTPALDTAIENYRKPVQLVNVSVIDDKYFFDFSEADKFIKAVCRKGIKWLELSHTATQWGAKFCPQIIATVNGEKKRIFGWETLSSSTEYTEFLHAYCKELKKFLEKSGYLNMVYFHISDEPFGPGKENFIHIKNVMKEYFPNGKYMDALSDKSLYDDGIITHPVVGLHDYHKFKSKYVYYCGGICENNITNRHFAMPSQRTRILGYQMFRNGCTMFLQWAVNFYNSVYSYYKLDPYFISDAGFMFVSGDSFIVYPHADGVYDSIRNETMCECWQDYRALELLANKIGKNAVIELLDNEGVKEGFSIYPQDAVWHKNFREKINEMIVER